MPWRKPVLGYPSQTDAILALDGQGFSNAAIASRLGMKPNTVVAIKSSARRSAARRGQAEPNGRTVVLPLETLQDLHPHADRRGLHVNALIRKLLEQVVVDDLVDAVLDDGASG